MKNKNLIVIARIKAKPGQEKRTLAELEKLVAPTNEEDGCIKYELHTSTTNPGEFMFYEIWTSKAALDLHSTSAHIQTFRSNRVEYLEGSPEVTLWEVV
jgi:quinol monooxygenase YgiN